MRAWLARSPYLSQGKLSSQNSTCSVLRSDWPWFQCLCGAPSFFCSLPPQLPCERQSIGVRSRYCLCQLVAIAKGGGKFWILCFSLTYLCFTHLLDFPETVIKIHPSDGSSPVLATESPLVARHLCKKLLQPDQNIWEKENHLVLTSSPCSQWADYRAFSWQKEKESLFFARIIEVHEDFPQISEIHKGTPRDRGNDPHSHLPRGWFIFCFMCDGH